MGKTNALHSWDDELLAELRAFVRRYTILARKAHVGNPVTQSAVLREAVRRELERRKVRAVIQWALPGEIVGDTLALRHFREMLQIDLQAVDLDVAVGIDSGRLVIECPAFRREAIESVLAEACGTAVDDSIELAEGPGLGLSVQEVADLIDQDRKAGEARRAREAKAEGGKDKDDGA